MNQLSKTLIQIDDPQFQIDLVCIFRIQIQWILTYQIYQIQIQQRSAQMKKINQTVQSRKAANQLFKYITPGQNSSTRSISQNSKAHTRSMIDLQEGIRAENRSKGHQQNKQNHLSSVSSQNEHVDESAGKSASLKKFLSMFGGNQNNNSVVNLSSINAIKSHREKEQAKFQTKQNPNSKQIFTCNIKNMNVNVSHSKEKDYKAQSRPQMIIKKDKTQANSSLKVDNGVQMVLKLKKLIEDGKQREKSLLDQITVYQKENKQLQQELKSSKEEVKILEERYSEREHELLLKIERIQRQSRKQKCKDHQLIIQSLKKVINEQLRKIIQLQKSKVEREEIQKLEERINQNMGGGINVDVFDSAITKIRGQLRKDSPSQQSAKIRIQDDEPGNTNRNIIEEADEEDEQVADRDQSHSVTQSDSILEEVDEYLAQWRGKS